MQRSLWKELSSCRASFDYNTLVLGVTDRLQPAFPALGVARLAQRPPVQNNLVSEQYPLVLRDRLHEVLLDLDRVGVLGEIEPLGDALHVRIHHHARGNAV